MRILNFKLFEQKKLEDNFPSLEEVRSYFYDFTDEIGNISRFDVGYVYFESERYSRLMQTNERPVDDFIDISNTTLLSGDIPSYEYMSISFNDLFDEDKLDILIHCLKVLYSETEFRPFGCLWTEEYPSDNGNDVITKLGFAGTFFRGSDEEYLKFCKIFDQGNRTKDLVKYFI